MKIIIALLLFIVGIYFFLSKKEKTHIESENLVSASKEMPNKSQAVEISTTEVVSEESNSTDSESPSENGPLERIESLNDPNEISILVLETMKSSEFETKEKARLLSKSVGKSTKIEGQNLIESVIISNSDPELLAHAFNQLAQISSQKELREFFDRLEIMSSYTVEKDRAIEEARTRYLHTREN